MSNLGIPKVVSQYMKISKMTQNAKYERVSWKNADFINTIIAFLSIS